MPSGTFEADLHATREARGLSLDEIQQQTRIPVDVLRRFESGDLVGDPTFNEVYLKAFLQSYAKAVGVSPAAVAAALAAHKAGTYDGSLHPDFDPGAAPRTPPPTREALSSDAATPPPTGSGDVAPARTTPAAPPAVQALRETPAPSAQPRKPAAKPSQQARVNRPAVPTAKRSFDKNWTTILGLFGVFVVALALAFYFLVFRGDDVPDTDEPTVVVDADGGETSIDSSGIGAGAAAGGPQLQFPIQVNLTAGGDGLQSFRVTEDAADRRPYWIDLGTSQDFQADSVLILWGEDPSSDFSEATVEIQGIRFTPQSGRPLRIDRQSGQRLLDSLATAPAAVRAPAGTAPEADATAFE